jgi:hypothetical protein
VSENSRVDLVRTAVPGQFLADTPAGPVTISYKKVYTASEERVEWEIQTYFTDERLGLIHPGQPDLPAAVAEVRRLVAQWQEQHP